MQNYANSYAKVNYEYLYFARSSTGKTNTNTTKYLKILKI